MGTPVVFIHGLWIAAGAWEPWIALFEEASYDAVAPTWPGEPDNIAEARRSPERQAGIGIDAIVDHYANIIGKLDERPIVIGHSFGGLFAQKLLAQDLAAAAVAIDPAPMKGILRLPIAQLRSAFPVLGNPVNKNKAKGLTAKQFRYAFGNALSEAESDALHAAWAIPGPALPLFEAAFANFRRRSPAAVDTANSRRGPLLLISGTADHTVPDVVTRAAFKRYGSSTAVTELQQFDGRGHSLTIDSGWRDVADAVLEWVRALPGTTA
ncbi:MAG: alpha/beta fold hydrolase [Acidimicrobiia bacterium]